MRAHDGHPTATSPSMPLSGPRISRTAVANAPACSDTATELSSTEADCSPTSADAWLGLSLALLTKLGGWSMADGRRPLILGPSAASIDPLVVLAHEDPEWFVRDSPWAAAVASAICPRRHGRYHVELDSSCTCNRASRHRCTASDSLCRCGWGDLDELIDNTDEEPTSVLQTLGGQTETVLAKAAEVMHPSPLPARRWQRPVARMFVEQRLNHDRRHATLARNVVGRKRK